MLAAGIIVAIVIWFAVSLYRGHKEMVRRDKIDPNYEVFQRYWEKQKERRR